MTHVSKPRLPCTPCRPRQSSRSGGRSGAGMMISSTKMPTAVRSASDVRVVRKAHPGNAVQMDDVVVTINKISTKLLSIPEVRPLIPVDGHWNMP